MKGKIFSDLSVCRYDAPNHPEGSWRVSRTIEHLKKSGWVIHSPSVQAQETDVFSVHTERHWYALQMGEFDDPDTPFFNGIADIALTSLSGALSAMETALQGEPAFSLMRPPGHHAGRERISGFCYLNNMAIACRRAISLGKRVAVIDIDVHHGDGTEEIAWGQKNWFVVSLHQSPLYPGTGLLSNDNCVNLLLKPNTGEIEYLKVLEHALELVNNFKPDLIGVSAGFDTYEHCPIAQLSLKKDTYRKIGQAIARLDRPRFALLEGGYATDLPVLIENFIEGFF